MFSAVTGIGIAAVIFGVALFKGRTGWHWAVLSVVAFAALWFFSIGVLYAANVHVPFERADKALALFAGILTGFVIIILLVCVPHRPRRQATPLRSMRRDPAP